MVHLPHPRQNRLLNMLEASGESFLSLFQLVYLPQNEILFETGQQLAYSYFPITAVISTVFESTNRLRLETEAIRNDGVFGLPTTIDNLLVTRAIVQSAGHAYRIETCLFGKELVRCNDLLQILLKFVQLRFTKIGQIAVCSRFHTVEQQLSRILLNALDYSPTNTIAMTQQTIADKLNVRRESITFHAANLQRQGIINWTRGKINVLNRAALEKSTCECYHLIANETDRLLTCTNKLAPNRSIAVDIPIKDLEYHYH